ncbi:MAG: sulfatase, partial [Bacteroidales bacterium]|nr:sulfatase [Bacteroidales bacterium]
GNYWGMSNTIVTPHLSRLADEGVRYTNVYSVCGVCSPSRSALATGLYPTRIGAHHMQIGNVPREMMNNPQVIQFIRQYMPQGLDPYEVVPPPEMKMHSEYLREKGYYCSNNLKEDYQFKPSPFSWDESSATAHWRNREEGQPFFAVFNFMITHESRIWMKAEDSLWVDSNLEVPIPSYLPETEISRTDIRRMYSNVAEMDHRVGELLQELEEDGELENTIIFWYSDHGGPLPRQKRLLYDSGLKVPMIIRFPGSAGAGSIDAQMISFVDFLPTLLSLACIEPPEYLDGQAFLGKYEEGNDRHYIHAAADRFDEHADMIRAVRNERYKYLRNFNPDQGYYLPLSFREQMAVMQEMLEMRDAGTLDEMESLWFRLAKPEEELFDCENDPEELHNLAGDPQYAEKLSELRAECNRWMEEIDDMGFIEEHEMVARFWPGGKQPLTKDPSFQISEPSVVDISTDEAGSYLGYQVVAAGDTLSSRWEIYTGPVKLEDQQQLYAIAHRKGYLPSTIVKWD